MTTEPHSRKPRRPALCLAIVLLACLLGTVSRAQTPVTLFRNFVGHVNFQATGGSLRTASNTSNACALGASSTSTVAGVPAGAIVRAAYLYWAGSGATTDTSVILNGSPVAATRTFSDTYTLNGTSYRFFAGFADVTARVAGNGAYTFSGLAADSGAPYCAVQAVVAGWSLVVVYEHAAEDLRAVNVFDGFELFRSSALSLTVDTFRIPAAPINGKVTLVTWEGDPQNSGPLGGFSESLTFNGSPLDDGLIPAGSAPAFQQFDGTINTLGSVTSFGVDVDTYDVSALLGAGDTSASTTYSSGSDLVLLSAEVISFTTEPIVDLSVTVSHVGSFMAGSAGQYTIRVANNGPEDEVNAIAVSGTLPAGLGFSGGTGTGWSCSAAQQDWTCTHAGPLAVGSSLPELALSVSVAASTAAAVTTTATVASSSIDADATNNASSDTTTVLGTQPPVQTSGTKTLYVYDETTPDPNGFAAGPGPHLSRTPPAGAQSPVAIPKSLPARSWIMTPALQAPLTIAAGSMPVTLWLSKTNNGVNTLERAVTVELGTIGAVTGPLGSPVTQTFAAPQLSDPLALTFDVPLTQTTTLPAGTQILLTVTNVTPGGGQRSLYVLPTFAGSNSRIDFDALTVIHVDSATVYDAAFPAGNAQTSIAPGTTASIRADVSDPFGAFDIGSVSVDIFDDSGAAVLTGQPMSPVLSLSGAATRFELLYPIPLTAVGTWTYRIRAIEGTEGTVTHEREGSFSLAWPRLTLTKSVFVESDPANGNTNPKAIPGAIMVYTVTVANAGTAAVDSDSVAIRDVLPAEAALFVDRSGGDPIVFADGTTASGLTFDYAADVRYSRQPDGGAPFDYVPTPDAAGFDAAVTGIHVTPQGTLSAASGGAAPAFTLRYRTRLD